MGCGILRGASHIPRNLLNVAAANLWYMYGDVDEIDVSLLLGAHEAAI
jgi:hypothetical protein